MTTAEQETIDRLAKRIAYLSQENKRLKAGEFTPEEFQNLCHNLDKNPNCKREDFEKDCIEYQNKLFGEKK